MTSFKLFATLVLIATAASTLTAETHCPGNAASLPLRMVNRHQMVVSVSINHAGPFNFLLDTGTQMTMLDPVLAATLQVSTSGTATVASTGVSASASYAQVQLIEAGSRSTTNQDVLVYDLKNLQATGLDIQGVLGEDLPGHGLLRSDPGPARLDAADTVDDGAEFHLRRPFGFGDEYSST